MKHAIEDLPTILNKSSDVTQSIQCYDESNSIVATLKNADVIEKYGNAKKPLKIVSFQDVTNILSVKKATFSGNVMYNMQLQNTYDITNDNVSSNVNTTYIIDNISNDTFAPIAESTNTENPSTSQCEIHDNNTDSDSSVTFDNNIDDSFHLSDCSVPDDVDEDEIENTRELSTDASRKKTVNNSTLNLTLFSSKTTVCDDRNMYVEISDSRKSKRSMCPYCKKLQTQFTRHLETIHKTEEDVKKMRYLPKGKLYLQYRQQYS